MVSLNDISSEIKRVNNLGRQNCFFVFIFCISFKVKPFNFIWLRSHGLSVEVASTSTIPTAVMAAIQRVSQHNISTLIKYNTDSKVYDLIKLIFYFHLA